MGCRPHCTVDGGSSILLFTKVKIEITDNCFVEYDYNHMRFRYQEWSIDFEQKKDQVPGL